MKPKAPAPGPSPAPPRVREGDPLLTAGEYLTGPEVETRRPLRVLIKRAVVETMRDGQQKPVIIVDDGGRERKLVLNRTNRTTLLATLGSDYEGHYVRLTTIPGRTPAGVPVPSIILSVEA